MLPNELFAQDSRVDSLRFLLNQSQHDTMRIAILLRLSNALRRVDVRESERYVREAISLATQVSYKSGVALGYRRLGNLMRIQSRHYESLEANLQSLQLYRELNDTEGIASVLSNTGEIYEEQGNYSQALEYYLQAFELDKTLRDSSGAAVTINNIGIIYEQQGKVSEALDWYLRALPLYERHRAASLVTILGDIGVAYRKLGQYKEAKEYLLRAENIAAESRDYGSEAHALLHLGLTEHASGNGAAGVSLLKRAYEAAKKGNRPRFIAESLLALGNIYRTSGQSTEAIAVMRQALDTAQRYGFKVYIRDAAESLSLAHHAVGKNAQAFELQRFFSRYKDSVSLEETSKKLASYEYHTKLRQQAAETEVLRQEKAAQRIIIYVVAAGFGVSAVLLFLAVRSDRRRKRAYQELSHQKELVESQASEIEKANEELHNINQALMRQQELLETQAQEIELVNSELHEKNSALEALNKEKNEFLGIVSHDLKNPISAIILSVSMVKKYVEQMETQAIISQMTTIEKTASYMLKTLIQLLDVQVLEEGKITPHIVSVDVSATVLSVVEEYYFRAEQKNIHFVCDVATDHILMNTDNALLWQVLDNLISNAVKYSPHGKNIIVRLKPSVEAMYVEIQDEGPGISPDDMKKLFGKFARLSAQPTGGEHSTGLGLSIVKKMVEAMNGRVWCESELGKGATFIVELPKADGR